MQKEKNFIEKDKEVEVKVNYYRDRADYYPFNQPFLDEFYKKWQRKENET